MTENMKTNGQTHGRLGGHETVNESLFGYTDASVIESACPNARLLPERILRRIARERLNLIDQGRMILHDDIAVVLDSDIVGLIDNSELGLEPTAIRPHFWILIRKLSDREQGVWDTARRRRELWRRLFHGMVDEWLLKRRLAGQWRRSLIRSWTEAMGELTLKEIRTVLYNDARIASETSDAQMLAEFAAAYLDLKWFEPEALPLVFPGLGQMPAEAFAWMHTEVPAAQLFEASRLEGATLSSPWTGLEWITEQWQPSTGEAGSSEAEKNKTEFSRPPKSPLLEISDEAIFEIDADSQRTFLALIWHRLKIPVFGGEQTSDLRMRNALALGLKANKGGNFVGASRWLKKAKKYADRCDKTFAEHLNPASAISELADRLAHCLHVPDQADLWQVVLKKVFESDPGEFWSKDARVLYDLQQVVYESERPIYVVDWGGYLRSLGSQPARRMLPDVRYVLMLRHLRTALGRLPDLNIEESIKRVFRRLLEQSIHHTECKFRDFVRPILEETLEESGFRPANMPERVAVKSVVDQLIDQAVEHGYFGQGHLRDTLSRNSMKMPDLVSLGEWWSGDRLLKANKMLGQRLDGIYRPGEIYLRVLERSSSAVFARPLGRMLTWYLILPFLGAFMVMGGLFFIPEELNLWVLGRVGLHIHVPHHMNPIENPRNVFLIGLFMLGMIHHKRFRQWVLKTLRRYGLYLRGVLWDWPRRVLAAPIIKLLFGSQWIGRAWKWGIKPLLFTALIWWWIPNKDLARNSQVISGLIAIYVMMMVAVNSKLGRDLQEHVGEWVAWGWRRFGVAMLVSFYRMLADIFETLSESVNRALYAIDEFVRFRRRSGPFVEFASGLVGLVWGVVLYVIRFAFNLLIEPQINPIKHFPIVTVSHKFLLPMIPLAASAFQPLLGDDKKFALSVATLIMAVIPGAIGFIVWELKENWNLYEANRPSSIGPRPIGHHGETLLRLLHAGFHSGTVPKLLHRMRRSREKSLRSGRMQSIVAQTQKFHQLQETLRNFVDREWIRLINSTSLYRESQLALGPLWITNHSVSFNIYRGGQNRPLVIRLKSEESWIVAEIVQLGWSEDLENDQSQSLRVSLAGFYAQCGVDITEAQILFAGLHRPLARVMVDEDGLVVFPDPLYQPGERLIYDLSQSGEIEPRTKKLTDPLAILDGFLPEWRSHADPDNPWPVLDARNVNLKRTPVLWSEWIVYWGKGGRPGRLPERARLNFLPSEI
ncbi:MAG: hypothetical protein WCJ40_19910 [Planctomycetota bacterium]